MAFTASSGEAKVRCFTVAAALKPGNTKAINTAARGAPRNV